MIDYKYTHLFKSDSVDKQMHISFSGGEITNTDLHQGQFELNESLCSEDNLRFGCCEASSIKFKIANTYALLTGKKLTVSSILDGKSDAPFLFGNYKVYSDKPVANKKSRDITAYDSMHEIITSDVATWFNNVLPDNKSTVTLKQFRDSFFSYFGIEQEDVTLPNDEMTVTRTIDPEKLSGKTVITSICEINGCFGHISPSGKFQYVFLDPSDTVDSLDVFISAEYEEYQTEKITKLQIRKEENDIGCIYGSGNNCYVVQDNFLVYGKSANDLNVIAKKLYDVISNVAYTPVHVKARGNPTLSVGDRIKVVTNNKTIYTYILKRTLDGIQALRDTYDAEGDRYQSERMNSVHEQIIQLKGKSNVLKRTIDELSSTIIDVEQGLSSSIEQTANGLKVEITRATDAENVLSSRIEATESRITLEVSNLRTEIDGEFQTYNVDYEPTLLNFPAWDWTYNIPCNGTVLCNGVKMKYTDEGYNKNARTIAFNTVTSVSYRFTKNDDTKEWYWKEIANSEYANVLQQLSELKIELGKISTTVSENRTYSDQRFEELSSKITQTATSITAEVTRASSEEGKLSSRITQTAESITTEVNRATTAEGQLSSKITQTAESITAEVTRATTEEGKLSSKITQTAEKITLEVNRATTAEGQLSSKITQTAEKIELEVTRATNAEGTLSSKLQLQANEISARVTKSGGSKETFGWSLTSSAFKLFSGNTTVFNCNKNGITVSGYTKTDVFEAANARIKSLEADHVSVSSLNAVSAKVKSLEADHVTVKDFNALNATVGNIKANYITANSVTAELIQSRFQSPSAGSMTMGTIRAANIQKYDGSNYVSFVMRTATIGGVTLKYVGW